MLRQDLVDHDQFFQHFPGLRPRHGQPRDLEYQRQGVKVIDETGVNELIQLPHLPVRLGKRRKGTVLAIRLDPVCLKDFLTPFTVDLRIIQAELEEVL